uniref:Uncharacterized protein n=1 Tax=Rhizophora mucronata TaxID=61149 RepID=A0A2P2NLA2_RHIMU
MCQFRASHFKISRVNNNKTPK